MMRKSYLQMEPRITTTRNFESGEIRQGVNITVSCSRE